MERRNKGTACQDEDGSQPHITEEERERRKPENSMMRDARAYFE